MQMRKELLLHNDLNPGDVYFQYTTTSWVMWNYVMGGLTSGLQVVIYDGSPFYPDKSALLHIISKFK